MVGELADQKISQWLLDLVEAHDQVTFFSYLAVKLAVIRTFRSSNELQCTFALDPDILKVLKLDATRL
jgi:hypothetical protein